MTRRFSVLALTAVLSSMTAASAEETPTSYGPASRVDTPILRLPFMKKPPEIDGALAAGEWEDSSALTGFWYDFAQAKFTFLAPMQTQVEVYGGYDKENLYIAYASPVYPENSWLKARGRFPDVTHHPLYGLIWDDHIELELRPYHDIGKGFQMGLFKWFANPFASVADQYWSVNAGEGKTWQAKALVRSGVTATRWNLEFAIPLQQMVVGNYSAKEADGSPIVNLPPPPGTAYRCWFTRGIGGNGKYFNVFDKHVWNTTKTKLILDPDAPSFQVKSLGPIMDDIIDLKLAVKNHSNRSKTVRIGFFVENQLGTAYSSYEAPELKNGLLELVPGEVKEFELKRPFPGVSTDGNVLWFDVRSAGQPAKVLFRTRLIDFHSMDGGAVQQGEQTLSFRSRRVDVIKGMRPPRRDFDFRYYVSSYTKKVSGIVDAGIYGADETKKAVEAKLFVMKNNADEDEIAEQTVKFSGDFASFAMDVPKFVSGESYKVALLLFDQNKRIVGERNPEPFKFEQFEWMNNELGLDDVVWEPFTPIQKLAEGHETLKHRIEVSPSGLPAQIWIKPDKRELPLEKRNDGVSLTDSMLAEIGRGPQLRAPFRLEAIIDGKSVTAQPAKGARLARQWKSEFEYSAAIKIGPIDAELVTQYDCDGAMHCSFTYGTGKAVKVSGLEMVADLAGAVDTVSSAIQGGGMAGSDVWECSLSRETGIVWDNSKIGPPELYYSGLVPYLFFGSGDRGFSWFCDSDAGWIIDKKGTTMTLERNADGLVTWRIRFINHEAEVSGERNIKFSILTHPAKPKPENYRLISWLYRGGSWADEYIGGDLSKSDEELKAKANMMARSLAGRQLSPEEVSKWTPAGAPDSTLWRFYQLRGTANVPNGRIDPSLADEEKKELSRKLEWDELNLGFWEMNRYFQDKFPFHFDRHIEIGRRHGWWWDETWPTYRSMNVAEGDAYLRSPESISEKELPWQDHFLTGNMRMMFKRLARRFKTRNMPLRNYLWANTSATCFESFAWDTQLVEECGAGTRTFELDNVTVYPLSLWRVMSHNFTGLICRLVPDFMSTQEGDDKRPERQYLGRALLHDIGMCSDGPHGYFAHAEQAVTLINKLHDFGLLNDENVEYIPYWRSSQVVRYGNADTNKVYVTVFRRPLENGGYKALFVIMNESDKPLNLPLHLLDLNRTLGGPNTMKAADVRGRVEVPEKMKKWWSALSNRDGETLALRNFETDEAVLKAGAGESYGPVYVPYHDYRILYGESKK
ncbi:MAG: DUF6067 family protein [Planctomycetota bacterium]|nr:DUF6067 family protein [Planctomycetota bacterium]MDA1138420.1 DUF6067 family protein [Planctomycetota bacterium]